MGCAAGGEAATWAEAVLAHKQATPLHAICKPKKERMRALFQPAGPQVNLWSTRLRAWAALLRLLCLWAVRPLIYLFDIDGTLVTTAGAGRKALCETFRSRYGADHGLQFSFDGMTDKAIVGLALQAMAVPLHEASLADEVERVLESYVNVLASHAQASADAFVIHEGVVAVLDEVQAAGQGVMGLGTGNVRRGAEIKLAAVNLYHRFAFGGFGCDHHDRTALLAVGAARGAALLGKPMGDCDLLVIGDTPKDIAAAHGIGARCLAVATGSYSVEELQAAGGDVCVPRLDHPAAKAALLPYGGV